jgi:hypothetical protein
MSSSSNPADSAPVSTFEDAILHPITKSTTKRPFETVLFTPGAEPTIRAMEVLQIWAEAHSSESENGGRVKPTDQWSLYLLS